MTDSFTASPSPALQLSIITVYYQHVAPTEVAVQLWHASCETYSGVRRDIVVFFEYG